MRGMRIAAIACTMLLASCGQTQQPQQNGMQEPKTTSEGVAIKITVAYNEQAGPAGARFLKEGDHVAVISPLALPTRGQVDAVVSGFEGWGYVPVEGKHDVPADMDDYDGSSRGGSFASMTDMITRRYLYDLECPVAFRFPAGHGDANYPLLMGAEAHLDVAEGSYTLGWN